MGDHLAYQPVWIEEADREALAQRLAGYVADRLREALADQARVTLAVSGGRSPARFFEVLSEAALDWERVVVVPVDERVVAPGAEAANETLIRGHLLRNRAAGATLVSLLESASASVFDQLPWPPVVAVLGMGLDGHTASWFPGDPASLQAMEEVDAVAYRETLSPEPPHARLTLNWAALRSARERLLLIQGDDKKAHMEYILEEKPDYRRYPVARLAAAPLTVFWSP